MIGTGYLYNLQGKIRNAATGSKIAEFLYLTVLGFYLLKTSFNTTIYYIPWPDDYEAVLFIITSAVVMFKIGYGLNYRGARWLFCGIMTVSFGLSWWHTAYNYLFLLYIPMLIIGGADVDYKKILKVSFWINFTTLAVAFMGSCLGVVRDLSYQIDLSHRHSFGIMYTTDFAARVFYLLLAGWVLYENVHIAVSLFAAVFSTWFVYYYCQAKCSQITLMLLVLCMLYEFILRKRKWNNKLAVHIIDHLCLWCAPICAACMVSLSFFYQEKIQWMSNLDELLTQRLSLSNKAINQYGFTLWGTAFAQEGGGGSTAYNFFYNFIDPSYVLILLRYGTVVFALFLILYVYQGRRAIRGNHRKLLLAGTLVAIHSIIEHHMPEVNFNIFLILPFAALPSPAARPQREDVWNRKLWLKRALPVIAGIIVLLLITPMVIGYVRTLVYLFGYHEYVNGIYFIFWFLVAVALVLVLVYNAKQICMCHTKRALKLRNVEGLILSATAMFILLIFSNEVMKKGAEEYASVIQGEKQILERIADSVEEKIALYISDVPSLYKKEIKWVTDRFLPIEVCDKEDNVVLITPIEQDLNNLFQAGYSFGMLSESHGIYTNNTEVIRELNEAGITMTDYYNVYRPIDMNAIASANNLEINEYGSLILSGRERSIGHGPWISLNQGWYSITFDVQLLRADSYELGEARVTSDHGRTWWEGKQVTWADFDENGHGVIRFEIGFWCDVNNAEFLLLPNDAIEMLVNSVECRKIGSIK